MITRNNKSSIYKQNRFVSGYVPMMRAMIQAIVPIATSTDGNIFTDDTFLFQPAAKSIVRLKINNVEYFPANGDTEVSMSAVYITNSTGGTVRTQGTYEVGDKLRWNGSVTGIEILSTDEVKLIYEI